MNLNKQPSMAVGAFLIALGVVWWLNLWALLLPGVLLVGGIVAYQQRQRMGRVVEAVQIGLWGAGLALLFMLHFIWPGILFLAGTSVLIRGREMKVASYIQNLIAQFKQRRAPISRANTTQHVPITTVHTTPVPPSSAQLNQPDNKATTGETMRL